MTRCAQRDGCAQAFFSLLFVYFCCMPSTYLLRFAIRCCTSLSCPWLIFQNNEPHTGMSFEPWAGIACSPRITADTFRLG